jgi:hypothetical protein
VAAIEGGFFKSEEEDEECAARDYDGEPTYPTPAERAICDVAADEWPV